MLLGDVLADVANEPAAAHAVNQGLLTAMQRWQQQATVAGGGFHLLLGEHEIMALTEPSLTTGGALPLSQTAHGQWLARQPFVIAIDRELFAHAGIANALQLDSLEALNRDLSQGLKDYSRHWQYYIDSETRHSKIPFSQRFDCVKSLDESPTQAQFLALRKNKLFDTRSPVFYLGNSFCHPLYEAESLLSKLNHLEVDRLWVTHIEGQQQNTQSRFDGRLIMLAGNPAIDAGAVDHQDYDASIWLAKIAPDQTITIFQGSALAVKARQTIPLREAPARSWHRPYGMSDEAIAEFLQTASITSRADTLEGRTKPLKVTLEKDGKILHGIFKFINLYNRRYRIKYFGAGDRYQHEMAAYKIDRMLGIGLVPVTVEREIDGQQGTIQLWIDGMASALQINEGEIDYSGSCDVSAQENMMNVFDYLIMNFDRNQSNIVFTKNDWQIWFIDHTRSFGLLLEQPPYQGGVELLVTDQFRQALMALTKKQLATISPWLRNEQIEAIWTRRNRLLDGTYAGAMKGGSEEF